MPRLLQEFAFACFRSLSETTTTVDDHLYNSTDDHATDDHYATDDHADSGEHHSEFGVHISYEDLYGTVIFLIAIYLSGEFAKRVLQMPSLVGEIFCGIILGPPVLEDFVPNPEAWVMFGELGLVLLVIEAGIDIDVDTLKLIGTRGFLIAFVGSVLPIGIGMLITKILNITDVKGIIAAGATFGPTSLGIALNILKSGGVLNTPVGQLIISAAVIDDMIALVVLSQLEALVGEITVSSVLIPVVSALGFLIVGGYAAIFVLPPLINRYILCHFDQKHHGHVEIAIMFLLVIVLMPATYYGKASYLMGCFVAGLTFCTSHNVHHMFSRQFKRLLQWLMRVFFAASIGFQVPITDFANGTVIWQGLVYTLALTGKVAVGFMVPNFTQEKSFKGFHLRDCLITGFSMAAEGEFAFVIAVFAVEAGLISADLYASVVLAVLLSTIVPPFLLRFTISYWHKISQAKVEMAAEEDHSIEDALIHGICNNSTVFLCIETQSESRWGLMNNLMSTMNSKGLDIIDHRAWNPRGFNTTLVNEIYARAQIDLEHHPNPDEASDVLLEEIKTAIEETIDQPEVARVKVTRWHPGIVEEIVDQSVNDKSGKHKIDESVRTTVSRRLLDEAASNLERKQQLQTSATANKTIDELLGPDEEKGDDGEEVKAPRRRRIRQKTRSTPSSGAVGLFGEVIETKNNGRDPAEAKKDDAEDLL